MDCITLAQLNQRVAALVTRADTLRNVWVTAEISDLRSRPGSHCYLDLIAKDDAGRLVEKLRANIWAQTWSRLSAKFQAEAGTPLANGMKVMVLVTVGYSGAYGLAANITDINAAYTMGGLLARRNEILSRLQREGVLTLNRELPWPETAMRIAVVSARDAAGYGDFINQLYHSASRLRFTTRLFPAVLQGDRAVPTIIEALDQIAQEDGQWDCVVLIRGGGATTDFAAFENYDLAAHIAQFPIPVVIGIGHERDVTLLDYVANMRVKTPTAAAEWLVARADANLARADALAREIHAQASRILAQAGERLAYAAGALPHLPGAMLDNARRQTDAMASRLATSAQNLAAPQHARLASLAAQLAALPGAALQTQTSQLSVYNSQLTTLTANALARAAQELSSKQQLLEALSPQATLARGYSITRVQGHAVTDPAQIPEGELVETTLLHGTFTSIKTGGEKNAKTFGSSNPNA